MYERYELKDQEDVWLFLEIVTNLFDALLQHWTEARIVRLVLGIATKFGDVLLQRLTRVETVHRRFVLVDGFQFTLLNPVLVGKCYKRVLILGWVDLGKDLGGSHDLDGDIAEIVFVGDTAVSSN